MIYLLLPFLVAGAVMFFGLIPRRAPMTRYSPGDTFESHECILCKRDRDGSYCISKRTEEGATK